MRPFHEPASGIGEHRDPTVLHVQAGDGAAAARIPGADDAGGLFECAGGRVAEGVLIAVVSGEEGVPGGGLDEEETDAHGLFGSARVHVVQYGTTECEDGHGSSRIRKRRSSERALTVRSISLLTS